VADVIHHRKVLVVEGNDEINFFGALLNHMGISGVDVREVGGKEQFKKKMPALVKTTGFSGVEIIAIIQDADDDAGSTTQRIKDVLKRNGLEPPYGHGKFSHGNPRVGIFIVPDGSGKGMLEDLCLSTVKRHPAMPCVELFVQCVSQLDEPPHNMGETKAQAFLAAMPEIVNNVGIGAQKNYWEFECKESKCLKSFLQNLR
jgi:hypothetical protein